MNSALASTCSARRHQGLPVLERPAVVLHMRDLEAVGAEVEGELDDGGQAGNILTVDRRVKRQGQIERASSSALPPASCHVRPHSAQCGRRWWRRCPGSKSARDRGRRWPGPPAAPRQQNPGGDQVRVKANARRLRNDLCQIAPHRRLPPDKCSCSTPSSAACANTSHHASVDSSSRARSRSSGFEQ